MELYIFKTNIDDQTRAATLSPIFKHPSIKRWTIDTEDTDKVLKVETHEKMPEDFIIDELRDKGFLCEALLY